MIKPEIKNEIQLKSIAKTVSEDLEPLQYIEFVPGTNNMKYGNWEEAFNADTKFLALVINRIILEIEKIKEEK